MEEADALEALSNTLTLLTEDPYDITLHAQHVRLARASGMEDQLESALDMVTSFWAAGSYVWLPVLDVKMKGLDLDKAEDVQTLFALFERAEEDYLCECCLLNAHARVLPPARSPHVRRPRASTAHSPALNTLRRRAPLSFPRSPISRSRRSCAPADLAPASRAPAVSRAHEWYFS